MVRKINLNELWLKSEAVVKAEGAVSGVPLIAPFNDALTVRPASVGCAICV